MDLIWIALIALAPASVVIASLRRPQPVKVAARARR